MDDAIITNYNRLVGPNDQFIILGDFARYNTKGFRDRINCKSVWLIRGNHDPKNIPDGIFERVEDLCGVWYREQLIILCHYAMRTWHQSHRGSWHIYAHSHGQLKDDPYLLSMDIGVDSINNIYGSYRPISFDELEDLMIKKQKLILNCF